MKKMMLVSAFIVVGMVGTACGQSQVDHAAHGEGSGRADHGDGDGSHAEMEGKVPGSPADAADAGKRVVVRATDQLRFEPESLEVDAGEIVTFVVRNVGRLDHEFVLGDSAYQEAHGAAMDGAHQVDMRNAVSVAPGATEELTWRFDGSGDVLFGCHVQGHYQGGMAGKVKVL